jgi:hypothetical protein
MRSAVNVQQIGRARVPDNSRMLNSISQIGETIGSGINQYKARNIRDELLNGASEAVAKSPEQRQADIQTSQIDLAEEQQVAQTQQQAQAKREEIQRANTWRDITANPELAKKFMDLQARSPQMAQGVANTLLTRDQNQVEELQREASQWNGFAQNVGGMAIDPKVDDEQLLSNIKAYAAQETARGVPVDKIAPLLGMNNDERYAWAQQQSMLSGQVHQIAEQSKPIILASGAQMRNADGSLLAENEKRQSPNEAAALQSRQRSNDLREREQNFNQGKLTNVFERELIKAQDAAQESQGQVSQLESVAQEYENLSGELGSGQSANVKETLKTFFGDEDAATNLRKRYNQIVNKKALDNLPPGAASEKDVEIVFKGFLTDSANPKQVASFLRGLAKVEAANANFQSFKAQYISDNRDTRGFQKAWKEELLVQSQDDDSLFGKYGGNE